MKQNPPPLRFAVESTLGKLAKWLRILGYDTIFERSRPSAAGAEPDRIIITRTRRRFEHLPSERRIFIRSDRPEEQLREVIRSAGLTADSLAPFTRCIRCNEPIEKVARESVRNRVPDYVWQTRSSFRQCPRCGRIYWPGTHVTRSLDRIGRLFDNARRDAYDGRS